MTSEQSTRMNSPRNFQMMKSKKWLFACFEFLGFCNRQFRAIVQRILLLAIGQVDEDFWYVRILYPSMVRCSPSSITHFNAWIFHLLPQIYRSRRPAGAFD